MLVEIGNGMEEVGENEALIGVRKDEDGVETVEVVRIPAKFPAGAVVVTRSVFAAMLKEEWSPVDVLKRHLSGDWGELDEFDTEQNETALKIGERLFSSYETEIGKVWVITERDRSATTVLFPSDY